MAHAHALSPAGTSVGVRHRRMPRIRPAARYKTIATIGALAVAAGLLSAAGVMPIVGVVGVAIRNAATTFNTMPVAGLGQLPARSEMVDSSGHLIAYYYPRNIYRVPVTYRQIAPVMRDATVAIEDARFWDHGALDLRGTVRAIISTLSGSQVQGGSDIAQQFVKNACILTARTAQEAAACTEETVARKVRELRIAANVMREMTRPQLLAAYLDAIYFGNEAYGVQVAAQLYFSTSASRLSLAQAATLAGLVQDPAAYDPLAHPQAALARRDVVLHRMAQLGSVTRTQAALASREPLGLHVSAVPLQTGCTSPVARWAAFFCAYVLAVMRQNPAYAKAWAALNFAGGMTIDTTLSAADQRAADDAVNFVVPAMSGYYNPGENVDTEVMIQPGTGYVRAIAVDRTFGTGPGDTTVDYAVNTAYGGSAGVQAGSSAKVFTLVTALEQGLPFGYHLRVTSPTTVGPYYNCKGGYVPPFNVINAEGPQGPKTYTLYDGTVESINAFYATLEQRVGLCNVVRTAVSLGMTRADGTSLLRRDPRLPRSDDLSADNYPSFTLGSVYVSPMSMADAYATLAARGVYCQPVAITAITASDGERFGVPSSRCHQAVSPGVADAANYVLQGVLGPNGTGYNRGIGIPAAAKTGTANGGYYADFAGYTPRLAAYVSVFNPVAPTAAGAMVYPRADYREVDGSLAAPGQMFGDNAPGATWQMSFLRLHLPATPFAYPPAYPFFGLPLHYTPHPKKKHTPTPSPTPTPAPTPTPIPTPTPTLTPTRSASAAIAR
ncbi:MAG TPA: transglycosylase domain-containing protein [Streptosporangiaceae bacterium]|nr:transglycosylase domain-containing protein [Streptosporangiaceae bacterium]